MAETVKLPTEPVVEPNAFTKEAVNEPCCPEGSPEAEARQAFRAFQLGETEGTPEEAVSLGLPHPDTQVIPEEEEEAVVVKEVPKAPAHTPFKLEGHTPSS